MEGWRKRTALTAVLEGDADEAEADEPNECLELRDDDDEWRRNEERTPAAENWARMVWKREVCMSAVLLGGWLCGRRDKRRKS